jgi:glycosyltransferase involved in cell wall biosynthesis
MRILHVIAGAKQDGADQLTLDAVTALAAAGLEQCVVTRAGDRAGAVALAQARVPFKFAAFDKNWIEPTKAAIRVVGEKFRPDIVHYWMGRAAMFAPKALRARNVGWHGGFHKLARFKHCDWHMAASQSIAARIIKEGAPAERVDVVAPFADSVSAAPADRAALQTPDGAHVVLAFARPHRKKGFDTLIEAVARMPGVYLWIVNEGESEQSLRDLAKQAGIAERTRLLGRRIERAALLAACDAVALPARLEPFGQAAAEVWAAGRPLVATEASGPAAGATDEVDVLLAPRDDSKALRERLGRVLEDAELARRLIENGVRAYEANYTRTAFVRASMAFYERVRQSAQGAQLRKPAA